MNEQQLADLFSEQLDRLFQDEPTTLPSEAGDLPELLEIIGQSTTQTHFQAGPAAQAAFQSQLASWFGSLATNGGSLMTILGLSKIWFLAIISTIVIVGGAGLIAVVVATAIFIGPVVQVPSTTEPTGEATAEPTQEATVEPTGEATADPTGEPPTGTPTPPTLIFVNNIIIAQLCQGAYTTQSTLVNIGSAPINNAALVWEVIEGAELVDTVGFNSASLIPAVNNNAATETDPAAVAAMSHPLVGAVDFQPISVSQDIKLDIKVKIKEDWWKQKHKTEIKIKLSVKNKINIHPRHGHGHTGHSQIITIVRQDAQWVTLTGFPHNFGENKMLVDGHVVVVNDCTGLPANWPPGSNIQVVGWLQPDGTFIAINIIVINIDIITGDFDSGVPLPGGGGSGGSDGGYGGSGGS